jgi:leucyl-tRNA synthetase
MSTDRRKPYPYDALEPKWQALWAERKSFVAKNPGEPGFDASRPKYYVLDMFPYPSGAGLHVGHPEGYTATDIVARYRRMCGFNVLHPMGWDAFGLPAEQYAIKTGQHPAVTTATNVARFKEQLQRIGFAYDWSREVNTTDPGYYRWTQWIFLQIYNSWFDPATQRAEPISTYKGEDPDSVRLAFVSDAAVNWCQELGTVLSNEEVVDGKSEVGGHPVVRRPMRQWMLRITAYAQRLIDELEQLDWPDSIKRLQRNWIGRSEGAEVHFTLAESGKTITVFTTRPDTLYGATYMVLAPEHAFVDEITTAEQRAAVDAYREQARHKSDLERTELAKDKTGVWTGAFAADPVNGEKIPVWIADYVLTGYGTGAIMAVPAHDERDWEFARKYALPIREVVSAEPRLGLGGESPCSAEPLACFTGDGYAIHSGPLDGLPTDDAIVEITRRLEQASLGRKTVNYKLRDWLFSRQRYWGEPFPVVWENGRHRSIDASELPLMPPALEDFKPTGTPEPPLSKATEWLRYSESARRETNTMPQWAGSCWYYLRYCDPRNAERFVGENAESYWMTGRADAAAGSVDTTRGGVDLYVGGTEHAVLHLLYARFWHKVLFDLGFVSTREPFHRLVNQGLILGEDNTKMSKSRGNVVNPDDIIAAYGADSFRCYEMFMGPLEQHKPWSTTGVEGVLRFLARVWRLAMEEDQAGAWVISPFVSRDAEPDAAGRKVLHATIKKVTEDIEALAFNTAISQMMIFTNHFTGVTPRPLSAILTLLQVLNPFAPHMTEELWERLGGQGALAEQPWPAYDPEALIENEIELALQVNGKVRDKIVVPKDATKEEVEAATLQSPKIQEWSAGKTIKKVIVVPGKLVNVVVG